MHEEDPAKGGAPLADLKHDCASKGDQRISLFERQPTIWTWQRFHDFQLVTLKGIASSLLHAADLSIGPGKSLKGFQNLDSKQLYIPGEISRERLVFDKPVVAYASPSNPGAAAMAEELKAHFNGDQLAFLYRTPDDLAAAVRAVTGEAADDNPRMRQFKRQQTASSFVNLLGDVTSLTLIP